MAFPSNKNALDSFADTGRTPSKRWWDQNWKAMGPPFVRIFNGAWHILCQNAHSTHITDAYAMVCTGYAPIEGQTGFYLPKVRHAAANESHLVFGWAFNLFAHPGDTRAQNWWSLPGDYLWVCQGPVIENNVPNETTTVEADTPRIRHGVAIVPQAGPITPGQRLYTWVLGLMTDTPGVSDVASCAIALDSAPFPTGGEIPVLFQKTML